MQGCAEYLAMASRAILNRGSGGVTALHAQVQRRVEIFSHKQRRYAASLQFCQGILDAGDDTMLSVQEFINLLLSSRRFPGPELIFKVRQQICDDQIPPHVAKPDGPVLKVQWKPMFNRNGETVCTKQENAGQRINLTGMGDLLCSFPKQVHVLALAPPLEDILLRTMGQAHPSFGSMRGLHFLPL